MREPLESDTSEISDDLERGERSREGFANSEERRNPVKPVETGGSRADRPQEAELPETTADDRQDSR